MKTKKELVVKKDSQRVYFYIYTVIMAIAVTAMYTI